MSCNPTTCALGMILGDTLTIACCVVVVTHIADVPCFSQLLYVERTLFHLVAFSRLDNALQWFVQLAFIVGATLIWLMAQET